MASNGRVDWVWESEWGIMGEMIGYGKVNGE